MLRLFLPRFFILAVIFARSTYSEDVWEDEDKYCGTTDEKITHGEKATDEQKDYSCGAETCSMEKLCTLRFYFAIPNSLRRFIYEKNTGGVYDLKGECSPRVKNDTVENNRLGTCTMVTRHLHGRRFDFTCTTGPWKDGTIFFTVATSPSGHGFIGINGLDNLHLLSTSILNIVRKDKNVCRRVHHLVQREKTIIEDSRGAAVIVIRSMMVITPLALLFIAAYFYLTNRASNIAERCAARPTTQEALDAWLPQKIEAAKAAARMKEERSRKDALRNIGGLPSGDGEADESKMTEIAK